MIARHSFLLILSAIIISVCNPANAEEINLLPKYGLFSKNEAQKIADEKFLMDIDNRYKGNRKKAAEDVSLSGWQFLRQGNTSDAMRRFNQAWMIDNTNGFALWGMATISSIRGNVDQSLKLFGEAELFVGNDIDFSVDYARSVGFAGVQSNNKKLLQDALNRFTQIHKRAPQHTLNLQNWAIILFSVGNFSEAWKKIILAEATPHHAELDKNFIAALQAKMPRP